MTVAHPGVPSKTIFYVRLYIINVYYFVTTYKYVTIMMFFFQILL